MTELTGWNTKQKKNNCQKNCTRYQKIIIILFMDVVNVIERGTSNVLNDNNYETNNIEMFICSFKFIAFTLMRRGQLNLKY